MAFLRAFKLLMYKNVMVRKRFWISELLLKILIPILVVCCAQYVGRLSTIGDNFLDGLMHSPTIMERKVTKLPSNYTLLFAPKTDFTRSLIDKTKTCAIEDPTINDGGEYNVLSFSTKAELTNYMRNLKVTDDEHYLKSYGAIIFEDSITNSSSKILKYELRTHNSFDDDEIVLPACLDKFWIQEKSQTHLKPISPSAIADYPLLVFDAVKKIFYSIKSISIHLLIISLMFPLIKEITYVMNEKLSGVNVLMAMQGVPNWLNLLSWLISAVVTNLIFITVSVISLSFGHFGVPDIVPLFYYGNLFLIWIVFILASTHIFIFGYHSSCYISKYLFMAILLIYIATSSLHAYIEDKNNLQWILPYLGVIFPNILFNLELTGIYTYETNEEGIGFSNLFKTQGYNRTISTTLGVQLILSVIGILIHFILTVYIYEIHPGQYGAAKHPLFFLKYFKKSSELENDAELNGTTGINGQLFESVDQHRFNIGIQIKHLCKTYFLDFFHQQKMHALDNVTINFYKGEITALLGKNGAGKSTMMSIITRMRSASSGTVLVDGKNIKDDSNAILGNMSFCPQEDLLFPSLSIFEQLFFFGLLKRGQKSDAELRENVKKILQSLNLFNKKNSLPDTLSGGQKRRACLAMALVGNANILILDEPTSGMDPQSRREAWNMILKMRGEKTILISTHDMEEADILGDRIAIMDYGKLKSYATPIFLKRVLGHGNVEISLATESNYDIERTRDYFEEIGQIINIDGGKIVIRTPNTPDLPDILDNIEEHKSEWGISGMSVSLITLEQIFLKVTGENSTRSIDEELEETNFAEIKTNPNACQTFSALIRKKLIFMKSTWISHLILFLLPILIPICIYAVSQIIFSNDDTEDYISYKVKLDKYDKPITFFNDFGVNSDIGRAYKNITESHGGSTYFVNQSMGPEFYNFIKEYPEKSLFILGGAAYKQSKNSAIIYYNSGKPYSLLASLNLLSNAELKTFSSQEYSIDLTYSNTLFQNNQALANAKENRKDNPIEDKAGAATDISNGLSFGSNSYTFVFAIFSLFLMLPLRENISKIKHLQHMAGVSRWSYWGSLFTVDFLFLFIFTLTVLATGAVFDLVLGLKFLRLQEASWVITTFMMFFIAMLPLTYLLTFTKRTIKVLMLILIVFPIMLLSIDTIMKELDNLASSQLGKTFHFAHAIEQFTIKLLPHSYLSKLVNNFYKAAQKNSNCRRVADEIFNKKCYLAYQIPSIRECCLMDCHNGYCKNEISYTEKFEETFTFSPDKSKSDFANFFEKPLIQLLCLLVLAVLYCVLIILIECKALEYLKVTIVNKIWPLQAPKEARDEQINEEKLLIADEISSIINKNQTTESNGYNNYELSGATNGRQFLAYNLHKRYRKLIAVDEVSFGVKKGQCFGLLGTNGAGKSTTFRMLTGEELPNRGELFMETTSIKSDSSKYLSKMSYCPQTHALLDFMNSYDHLRLFARIRGVPESSIESEIRSFIKKLDLTRSAHRPCETYSGGNKRKLSIAIALIGNPKLILLDEPTTGVDPSARRQLWNVIKSCQSAGQSIILTSHSMEECEVLCNRLTVMVDGRMVCIGASEELKQKFGIGYDIEIKFSSHRTDAEVEQLKYALPQVLVGRVVDESGGHMVFHVDESNIKWRRMYDVMKHLKSTSNSIEDYSIQSSTLEQLFLRFARGG